jgi:hypothetical protein
MLNSVTYSQLLPVTANGYVPPTNANNALDGVYPYPSATATSTNDSPGRFDLLGGMGEAAISFDATMYVLWDPALPAGCATAWTDTTTAPTYTPHASQCTSTPVPLGSVEWKWLPCAINALAAMPGGGVGPSWFKQCGSGQTFAAAANGYPQWHSCSSSAKANCQ